MKSTLRTKTPGETEDLAANIGKNLKGGEVIELVSDLGGGKTTFVRGLARGMGSLDRVASPTFTVSKLYKAGDKDLHHFDFYRLADAGLMAHELHDLLNDPFVVVVIEWAEAVHHVLPEARLSVRLSSVGDQSRELTIHAPANLEYVLEGVC